MSKYGTTPSHIYCEYVVNMASSVPIDSHLVAFVISIHPGCDYHLRRALRIFRNCLVVWPSPSHWLPFTHSTNGHHRSSVVNLLPYHSPRKSIIPVLHFTTLSSIGLDHQIIGPISTFNEKLGALQTGIDNPFPFFPHHPYHQLFHNLSSHLGFHSYLCAIPHTRC